MIRKIKMLLARRRLAHAVQRVEDLQQDVKYARVVLIPDLEEALRARELEYMSEQYLKDVKHVR